MTFVSGPFFCCIQLLALSFCPIVRTHRCPFLWIKYFIYGISSIENSIRCGCTKWRDAICKRRATTTKIIKTNQKDLKEAYTICNLCFKIILLFVVWMKTFLSSICVWRSKKTLQIPPVMKIFSVVFSISQFYNKKNSFQRIFMNFLRWPSTFLFI